jgi:hypothetical protein
MVAVLCLLTLGAIRPILNAVDSGTATRREAICHFGATVAVPVLAVVGVDLSPVLLTGAVTLACVLQVAIGLPAPRGQPDAETEPGLMLPADQRPRMPDCIRPGRCVSRSR